MFRRFASDEANSEERSPVESADGEEHGSVRSAIDSATETASTYAGEAAESLSRNAAEARDAVADTAAGVATAASQAFTPRERGEPREYNNRDPRAYPSRGSRGGYGGSYEGGGGYRDGRGNDRGGYGGERRPDRYDARPPMDRVLVPTPGIYIGNLLFDVTSSDLEKEFEPFGKIKSAIIATDARGLSKGYVSRHKLPSCDSTSNKFGTDSVISNSKLPSKPLLLSRQNTRLSLKVAASSLITWPRPRAKANPTLHLRPYLLVISPSRCPMPISTDFSVIFEMSLMSELPLTDALVNQEGLLTQTSSILRVLRMASMRLWARRFMAAS